MSVTGISNTISNGVFFSTVVQGRRIKIELPPQISPALHGLPPASPVFVGRDPHLGILLGRLDPAAGASAGSAGGPVVIVTAVGGLAGVGKTELALQSARTARDKGWFPGGVLFVDLFGYDDARRVEPAQALEGFLRALGVPGEHIPHGVQDRQRLYTSILASYARQGRRILVVIDNAATHEQARALLPADGSTGAVVTSRHTLGMLNARLLDLDILPMNDAVRLLDSTLRLARPDDTRVTDSPEDALRIAELCAGLPLALRIIGAVLIGRPGRPLAGMADELADEKARLEALRYDDIAVGAAFELSYRQLPVRQARLFRLLSLNPGPDASTDAVAVLAGTDGTAARRDLQDLARAHLVEAGVPYGRWRMHDLVRSFSDRLAAEDQEREPVLENLFGWYTHSVNIADQVMRPGRIRPDLGEPPGPAPAAFPDRNGALAWCEAEQSNLVAVVHNGVSEGLGHLVWTIPLSMWGFLTQTLSWDQWIEAHQVAADAAGRCGAHSGRGWLLNNLGTGYRAIGRPERSRAAFAAGLEVRRGLGDLHGQADSLKDMAMTARVWEDWEEALRLSHEALDVMARLTVPDRSGNAAALDIIAVSLAHLDRLDEAAAAAVGALAIWEDLDGRRDDRAWARCKLVHAGIARRRLEYGQAIGHCLEAREVFERINDTRDEAEVLRTLGELYMATDDLVSARVHWQRAVELFERLGDTVAVEALTHDLADLPEPAAGGEPDDASDDEA
ncbi:tetratricopeptide repeat protein [Streptomyces prunicolor]|uniref:ATP-binding protein n=1 Tax=Streptomyces prunicolor TaxID=67348 RepID=UPI002252C45F|nr:tetratricopeptide repeat protein [Streptomyces prunicolor]MCX5242717.1 tetratricopeptide repeat protein [Streptomyces prunicolor]